MATSQHKNFRLRNIPLECETGNDICSLIQKTLGLEPNPSPIVYSLALCPVDHKSKIATVSFTSIPESLSDHSRNEWTFPLVKDENIGFGRTLVFDDHFGGFTPLHRSSDEDCHIDVIAVCGLGGHALDSFKDTNGRFVWIRDGLPSAIPNARVLTYGYDTQLVGSRSFQNLTDLGRALQVDLEGIRDPNQSRSILFIGHSVGGLVIKETVRMLKEEPLEPDSTLLQAIFGFAFFGVPHRGLAVESLVPLVKDNPNRALLESLNRNSSLLNRLQIDFDKISQTRDFSIVSFYETEKSPTVAWVNDKLERSSTTEVLVDVYSATCGSGQQHPINRNNSEMVKFTGVHDQVYRRVMIALRPVMRIARENGRVPSKRRQEDLAIQWIAESEKVDINQEDKESIQKIASWAVDHEKEDIIRLFLQLRGSHTPKEIEQVLVLDGGQKRHERLVHLMHDSGKFDVNTKDRLGKTPLMHAIESCSEETLRLLLKTGKVDVQATDNEGNTALSITLRKGYTTIADLLSDHIRTTEMVIQPAEGYIIGP